MRLRRVPTDSKGSQRHKWQRKREARVRAQGQVRGHPTWSTLPPPPCTPPGSPQRPCGSVAGCAGLIGSAQCWTAHRTTPAAPEHRRRATHHTCDRRGVRCEPHDKAPTQSPTPNPQPSSTWLTGCPGLGHCILLTCPADLAVTTWGLMMQRVQSRNTPAYWPVAGSKMAASSASASSLLADPYTAFASGDVPNLARRESGAAARASEGSDGPMRPCHWFTQSSPTSSRATIGPRVSCRRKLALSAQHNKGARV